MGWTLKTFAGIGLALAMGAAQAETLQYEPGQVFVYDNGRVEEVRAVEGDRVTWAARSGRTYVRDVNPAVPILEWSYRGQTGARQVLGNPDGLFPLRPGARVQFRTVNSARAAEGGRSSRSLHLWTCSVGRQELVVVPAGRFSAFPLVCDRFSSASMRVLERLTWHIAPEVGHYVRREARNMRDGTTEVFRLHAALPPREANALRIEALARQAEAARPPRRGVTGRS